MTDAGTHDELLEPNADDARGAESERVSPILVWNGLVRRPGKVSSSSKDGARTVRSGAVAEARGFDFVRRGGDVVITHHGRKAATLRGAAASRFLEDVERGDPQQVMARATGNYERGNERVARRHPRNR